MIERRRSPSGALSEEEGSGYRWELGDLNHDGAWTAVDALMILNRSVQTGAGKETG